jgi:hypothetical protein
MIRSMLSPTSMRLPTPVSWLTVIANARSPTGTVSGTARFWKSAVWTCWPATVALRVVLPMACDTSSRAPPSRAETASVRLVTISAVTTVPNGMSRAATTVDTSTIAVADGVTGPPTPPSRDMNSTTTNVSAARKMPSSKTSRLVRRTNEPSPVNGRWALSL